MYVDDIVRLSNGHFTHLVNNNAQATTIGQQTVTKSQLGYQIASDNDSSNKAG